MIKIFEVENVPIFQKEEEIWTSFDNLVIPIIESGDIIVVAHTPFSRTRGPIFKLSEVVPSSRAIELAKQVDKTPEKIEVILQLSNKIIKVGRNVIITENKAGIICANGGADESNAGLGYVLGIPPDPDALAEEIKDYIFKKCSKNVAIIISDTVGRALRMGAVNIAIGTSGLPAIKSEIGKNDLFGYEMRVSEIAIADEIAAAAELLQGQTDEGNPFIIVRGYEINFEGPNDARSLNRPENQRLFG